MPIERKTINGRTRREKTSFRFSRCVAVSNDRTEQNRTVKETRGQNERQSIVSLDSFFCFFFSLVFFLLLYVS